MFAYECVGAGQEKQSLSRALTVKNKESTSSCLLFKMCFLDINICLIMEQIINPESQAPLLTLICIFTGLLDSHIHKVLT